MFPGNPTALGVHRTCRNPGAKPLEAMGSRCDGPEYLSVQNRWKDKQQCGGAVSTAWNVKGFLGAQLSQA